MAVPVLFICFCAYVLPMRAPPGALAHVSATQVVMKNLDTFDELAGAVKSYLSTIEPAALNDPEAPSPLAYLELRNAGRAPPRLRPRLAVLWRAWRAEIS